MDESTPACHLRVSGHPRHGFIFYSHGTYYGKEQQVGFTENETFCFFFRKGRAAGTTLPISLVVDAYAVVWTQGLAMYVGYISLEQHKGDIRVEGIYKY
jgi:hypothetical protein